MEIADLGGVAEATGRAPAHRHEAEPVDSVTAALRVLGLAAGADAGLVEIAYWTAVEECHADDSSCRTDRRRMMERINRARQLALAGAGQSVTPERRPRALPHVPAGAAGAVLALLAATPAALLLAALPSASDQRLPLAIAASAFTIAILAAIGWLVRRRFRPRQTSPFAVLQLSESAQPSVVRVVHRALRSGALARGAAEQVAELDAALSWILSGRQEVVPERPDRAPWSRVALSRLAARYRQRRAFGARSPALPAPPEWPDPVVTAPGAGGMDGRRIPAVTAPTGRLVVYDAGGQVATLPLEEGRVYVIGSGLGCDLQLVPAGGVGEEHARIQVRGNRVRYHHCDPATVSTCSGNEVSLAQLEDRDEVVFGPYRCRYVAALAEGTDRAAGSPAGGTLQC